MAAQFTAKYHGECPECGEDVLGELCEYSEMDEVVHVDCDNLPALPQRQPPLCSSCFTLHHGECL